jgi:hypothetical protein
MYYIWFHSILHAKNFNESYIEDIHNMNYEH